MGRRISKEFLHPSILEGVNDKIGNLDSLETDAKDNMVQAINELVEKLDNSAEIENGKELIANAVGEPLTAEESFDEMSIDINGLLSTFKTNMMNNGVTVESGDKFKALIDKIATMVEEGSGKGIQFAEGTQTFTYNIQAGMVLTVNTNLNFTPTHVFATFTPFSIGSLSYRNYILSNIFKFSTGQSYVNRAWISEVTSEYFKISTTDDDDDNTYINYDNGDTTINWWVIGVGEEDTTLRDSLASILEEEGVSVTEEDDMASLITKVDSEFDNRKVDRHNITWLYKDGDLCEENSGGWYRLDNTVPSAYQTIVCQNETEYYDLSIMNNDDDYPNILLSHDVVIDFTDYKWITVSLKDVGASTNGYFSIYFLSENDINNNTENDYVSLISIDRNNGFNGVKGFMIDLSSINGRGKIIISLSTSSGYYGSEYVNGKLLRMFID